MEGEMTTLAYPILGIPDHDSGQKNTLATRRASQLGHNESLSTPAILIPVILYLRDGFVASGMSASRDNLPELSTFNLCLRFAIVMWSGIVV